MKEKLMQMLRYFLHSADNGHRGASSKKIIAYMFAWCIVAIVFTWLYDCHQTHDYSLMNTTITILGTFITTLYGINVTDKRLNNPNKDKTIPTNENQSSESN